MENRSNNKRNTSKKSSGQVRIVKLNVGGSPFQTTMVTVCSCDNTLRHLVTGALPSHTDPDGRVFVDRSPKHFHTVLNYLRDGSVPLPHNTADLQELLAEAQYYLIEGLIHLCQEALIQKYEDANPLPSVPMVSSPDEIQQLLATTSKPVISLTINRTLYHCKNNADTKRFYENILKNMELFEKLSLKLSDVAIFVRNFTEQSEYGCSWIFHNEGAKELVLITDSDNSFYVKYPGSAIGELVIQHILNYKKNSPQAPVKPIPPSTKDLALMPPLGASSDSNELSLAMAGLSTAEIDDITTFCRNFKHCKSRKDILEFLDLVYENRVLFAKIEPLCKS